MSNYVYLWYLSRRIIRRSCRGNQNTQLMLINFFFLVFHPVSVRVVQCMSVRIFQRVCPYISVSVCIFHPVCLHILKCVSPIFCFVSVRIYSQFPYFLLYICPYISSCVCPCISKYTASHPERPNRSVATRDYIQPHLFPPVLISPSLRCSPQATAK